MAQVKPGQVWRQKTWAEPREATVTAVRQGLVYYRQGIKWRSTLEKFVERYEKTGENNA